MSRHTFALYARKTRALERVPLSTPQKALIKFISTLEPTPYPPYVLHLLLYLSIIDRPPPSSSILLSTFPANCLWNTTRRWTSSKHKTNETLDIIQTQTGEKETGKGKKRKGKGGSEEEEMKRGGGERAALNQRARGGEIETKSYLVFSITTQSNEKGLTGCRSLSKSSGRRAVEELRSKSSGRSAHRSKSSGGDPARFWYCPLAPSPRKGLPVVDHRPVAQVPP